MRYTVMIITMPQSEVIEYTDVHADSDAEAMEYALNQACFTGAQDYMLIVNDSAGEFSATVQGTRSARISTADSM